MRRNREKEHIRAKHLECTLTCWPEIAMKEDNATGGNEAATAVTHSGMAVSRFSLLLGVMSSLVWMGNILYIPDLPMVGQSLDMSEEQLSLTLTLFSLSFALLMPVIGPLSDAWGRRPFMLAGLAVFSLGCLICGIAQGALSLYAGRIVQGLGFGAVQVPVMAMVRDDCEGETVYRVLGILGAVTAIVPVSAMVVGGFLAEIWGWRPLFFCAFLFSVAGVLVCWYAVPETLRPEQRIEKPDLWAAFGTYRRIVFSRPVGMVGTPLFLCVVCEGAYLAAVPFAFSETFGLSPAMFGLCNLLICIGVAAGQYLSADLVKRFSPSMLYAAGGILCLTGGTAFAALILMSAMDTAFRFILPMLAFSFSFGFMEPIGIKSILTAFKETSAMASAIYFSLIFAMQGAGSIVTGVLMDVPLSPLASLAVVMAGAAVFIFAISWAARRKFP